MQTIERTEYVTDAKTGVSDIITKTLELILTPKPTDENYEYEEWFEETDTQYIQHWGKRLKNATTEDYERALSELGVSV